MDSYGRYPRELRIELRCPVQQLERRLHRSPGMALPIGISKNHHKSIARGLVNVAFIGVNAVQETGEVALDNAIDLFALQGLAQPRITANVHKQYRHVSLFLLHLGGRGIRLNEPHDRLRHKLGQVVADVLQVLHLLGDRLFQTQ